MFSTATMFAQQQTASAQQTRVTSSHLQRKHLSPEEIAKVRTSRLDKVVSLQADQKDKVYAIYLKEAQAAKDRAARNDEARNEIKSVLNEEQNTRLTEYQKERMDKMRQRLRNAPKDHMMNATPVTPDK